MRIEHLALNVGDPVAQANWYVSHCGFILRRSMDVSPFTCFVADSTGRVLVEFYNRTDKPVWTRQAFAEPLYFHLALVSDDLESDMKRLCDAGAEVIERMVDGQGYGLVMLRDPFGMPLQLCRRSDPLVSDR